MVCVADGTDLAAEKLERVLTNDPGMGVIRHVDAGYERAIEVAAERGVRDARWPATEGRVAVLEIRDRRRTRCCASAPARSTPEELRFAGVQRLIDDLIDTMRRRNGAGLAANQIGEALRIAVIEVDHNPRYPYKPPIPLTVVVNPVIEPLDDELVEINEGCLSVPDLRGNVRAAREHPGALPRPRRRRARRDQARPDRRARSSTSVDHLDGVLFLDRVADPRRSRPGRSSSAHQRAAFVERITGARRAGRLVTAYSGASWPGSAATRA